MKKAILILILCVACVAAARAGDAKPKGQLQPIMTVPGQIVLQNDFSIAARLDKTEWLPRQATRWEIADGVLRGIPSSAENQAKKAHHRGLEPRISVPATPMQFVAAFAVRFLEGEENEIVPFVEFGHHVCRVKFDSEEGVFVLADGETVRVAEAADFKFEPGKWYRALAELKGEEFVIQFANGPTLYARHECFAKPNPSGGIGLGVAGLRGGAVEIDDITIWSIRPKARDGWPEARASFSKFEPVPTGKVKKTTLRVLFIGNSYTARHNLARVVEAMAEAGNPGLDFDVTTVIYGGRTLADHWRLGTRNFVKIASLTEEEEKATIAALGKAGQENPKDTHAKSALKRHRELLAELESRRKKWDIVVLQSYRDDLGGDESLYAEYAPKFAEIARANGARVVLYETTPTTQNAEALAAPPDPAPVLQKARAVAALADRIDAAVVPMSLVALRCQEKRPDFTLRFINDAHLNQTMAYLTACTFYAALFERSPEGLPVDSITDIRFLDNDPANRDKDRDGNPITRTFSKKDAADLQGIAWSAFNEFQEMRQTPEAGLAGLASRHLEPLVGPGVGGTAVAFGIVRGDERLTGGFGRKGIEDGTPPDGKTIFEIGSVSKVFTGILLADAVVRGEVALDDPVRGHLPDGWTVPAFKKREIRMVDLSTHRSALPRVPLMLPADPDNPYADFTLEFLKNALANTTLQYKPGTRFAYSNLAVGLLGNALVHGAGVKDYEALLLQRIVQPLGLADTKIALEKNDRSRLAQPVALDGEPAKNWDIPALAGAGAIRSSADDMVRFIRANLQPQNTKLAAALELAQEPRAAIGDSGARMALGWFVSPDGRALDHNGQTGGYHSFLSISPEAGIGVFVIATGKALDKVDAAAVALMDELSGRARRR